jgi:hypothetical protein
MLFTLSLALSAALAPSASGASGHQIGRKLAEVRAFTRLNGDKVWPGLGAAPFEALIIEEQQETLLCRAVAPKEFRPVTRDPATGCERHVRPRSALPTGLLAAMPLFGPPSTIVMGTPAGTGRSTPEWTRTILHEHFPQWQASLPGYYDRTSALDLTGGDQTGMWMLNFPFPYQDEALGERYAAASQALVEALYLRRTKRFRAALRRYLASRAALAQAAGERNWRYLELQLWQEGVARWTEIELGRRYPDPAVRAASLRLEAETLESLRRPDLAQQGRELAYPLGAGEAMLLEACGPGWRRAYPKLLALGPLLNVAGERCSAR